MPRDVLLRSGARLAIHAVMLTLFTPYLTQLQTICRGQDWLHAMHTHLNKKTAKEPHIFGDMLKLDCSMAPCVAHAEGTCNIPSGSKAAHFESCGFSCKLFSRLFDKRNKPEGILASGAGSSGETFKAMISYMETHEPALMLEENVENILESSMNELDTFLEDWSCLLALCRTNEI